MHYRKSRLLTFLAFLLPVTSWGLQPDTVYEWTTPSRDGIGKMYMGREISQVMGHRGAAWLERTSRIRKERPDRVVDSLTLQADDVIADIGDGTGYFSFRIAPRVPDGRVLAVDIQLLMETFRFLYSQSRGDGGSQHTPDLSSAPSSTLISGRIRVCHVTNHRKGVVKCQTRIVGTFSGPPRSFSLVLLP